MDFGEGRPRDIRYSRVLPVLAHSGDKGLVIDTMVAAEIHGAHATAGEGVQLFLALSRRIAQAAVDAGADDGGVGRGRFR